MWHVEKWRYFCCKPSGAWDQMIHLRTWECLGSSAKTRNRLLERMTAATTTHLLGYFMTQLHPNAHLTDGPRVYFNPNPDLCRHHTHLLCEETSVVLTCCAHHHQQYTPGVPVSSQTAWCAGSRRVCWGSWRTCSTSLDKISPSPHQVQSADCKWSHTVGLGFRLGSTRFTHPKNTKCWYS